MNRFKFRVWDKHVNKFLNSENLGIMCDGSNFIGKESQPIYYHIFSGVTRNRLIIQQFTGLQDKNGKDIYEGDILSSEYYVPLKIEWREFYSGSKLGAVKLNGDEYDYYGCIPREMEVIGNIYENPNLLLDK